MKVKWLLIVFFLLFCPTSKLLAQDNPFKSESNGFTGGLNISFGSHVKRTGVFVGGYYYKDFLQVNAIARWYFNFKNLGELQRGTEKHMGIGLAYAFDESVYTPNHFVSVTGSQTGKKYSIGYGYNFYWDHRKTSQRTGTVGFQLGALDLVHENDGLAIHSDKYRTATLYIGYRWDYHRIGVNSILWTGDAGSSAVNEVKESNFSRFGYKDLSQAEYGHFSHGLLSFQYDYAMDYYQVANVNIGVDSERVRNVLQNLIVHDLYFWPKKWNPAKNPHVPMLDTDGNPYLYLKEQEIRKSLFYFNLGLNETLFY